MQAPEKITLTRTHEKAHGGQYWYTKPGSVRFTQSDIFNAIKVGAEIEFNNGHEELELLGALEFSEKGVTSNTKIDFFKQGDTALLDRVIRAGGFCEYVLKLEFESIGNEIYKEELHLLYTGD